MALMEIIRDDPRREDIVSLLHAHLRLMNELSAPEDVHALDVDSLCAADITFFAARDAADALLAVGALRQIDDGHCEIKSMHTAAAAPGQGVGRDMVEHLLAEAAARSATRVSLETGTAVEFTPARTLYSSLGFTECAPFGDYLASDASVCMTRTI